MLNAIRNAQTTIQCQQQGGVSEESNEDEDEKERELAGFSTTDQLHDVIITYIAYQIQDEKSRSCELLEKRINKEVQANHQRGG